MSTDPSLNQQIVDAALEIAAETGWESVSLRAAFQRAGVSPVDGYSAARTPAELLALVIEVFDRRAGEGLSAREDNAPPRDRLFEVVMARCDAMQEARAGLEAYHDHLAGHRAALLPVIGPAHLQSAAWLLDLADASAPPRLYPLQKAYFARLLSTVYRAWRSDDSVDLATTMRVLDDELDKAEKMARRAGLGRGGFRFAWPGRSDDEAGDQPDVPPTTH